MPGDRPEDSSPDAAAVMAAGEGPRAADAPTETAAAMTATAADTVLDQSATTGPHWRRGTLPIRVGRWRVVDRLGQGGMGEVFRVVADDGAVAALKRSVDTRAVCVDALRREAEALEALAQPGIARLIERGESEGRPWYAMAFVDGPTLRRHVVGRPLAERLPLLVELCIILDRLHRAGGVHRDVKPANVLVDGDRPVLIDFGLLVRIGGGRGQPGWARDAIDGAPIAAGTRGYRAPEQRLGDWCDGRTDLFAVGRILDDWLDETGEGDDALIAFAEALMAVDPADRPRDGALAARRLARIAGLEAPQIEPGGTPLNRAPSVGRQAEIDRLAAALSRAAAGQGGVVVLDGPSGIGKTRLALETVRLADGFRCIVGECRAVGGGLLQGLDAVVRHAADRCRGDAARTLAVFADHGPWLSPFVPTVAELPGQGSPVPTPIAARVADGVAHVARALAAERPVVIVVDDVQWADRLTALALERLADTPGRALVLLTARSDLPHDVVERLTERPAVQRLTLRPLPRPEAEALVGQLLGTAAPDPHLVAEVGRRAGGNPFFVAECLRGMIADGRLVAEDDGWRFAGDRRTLSLPAAAEAVIRARLQRLSPPGRSLIEALAVLGRQAPLDRIAALVGAPPQVSALDEVVRRAVCERAEGELRFAHDRLWQVTRVGVTGERRRALHRRAADDLEARPAADAYVGARARAIHLEGAGDTAGAGLALTEAGRLAEARGAVEDAAARYAEAAARLDGAEAARALIAEGRAQAAAGRYRDAAAAESRAAQVARAAGAPALEAEACSALGLSRVHTDQGVEAEQALRRAIALFGELDDAMGEATARSRLAIVCVHRGRFDEAAALHEKALVLQSTVDDAVGMARTLNNLAVLSGSRGQYAAALVQVTRALALARGTDRPSMALGIRMHRAQVLHRAGELDEARVELDASIEALERSGMSAQFGWALVGRATLMRHMGLAPAPGDLARAEAVFAELHSATCDAYLAIERGHQALAAGRDARDALDAARSHAERAGITPETPSLMGRALAGLIEAAAEAGDGLFRGQLWHRIFPGVRDRLLARGEGPEATDG